MNRFYQLLQEACEKMNRPVTVGADLKRWAQEAGFENVHHEVFRLPLGLWAKDSKLVCLFFETFLFYFILVYMCQSS